MIGDPITIVAGVLRERLVVFLLLVTIAKVGRYLAVIGVTLWFSLTRHSSDCVLDGAQRRSATWHRSKRRSIRGYGKLTSP